MQDFFLAITCKHNKTRSVLILILEQFPFIDNLSRVFLYCLLPWDGMPFDIVWWFKLSKACGVN